MFTFGSSQLAILSNKVKPTKKNLRNSSLHKLARVSLINMQLKQGVLCQECSNAFVVFAAPWLCCHEVATMRKPPHNRVYAAVQCNCLDSPLLALGEPQTWLGPKENAAYLFRTSGARRVKDDVGFLKKMRNCRILQPLIRICAFVFSRNVAMNGSRRRRRKKRQLVIWRALEERGRQILHSRYDGGNQNKSRELLKGADEMGSDSGWVKAARLTLAGPAMGQGSVLRRPV